MTQPNLVLKTLLLLLFVNSYLLFTDVVDGVNFFEYINIFIFFMAFNHIEFGVKRIVAIDGLVP